MKPTLTADDVKAIKMADSYCLRTEDGTARLTVFKKVRLPRQIGPFTTTDYPAEESRHYTVSASAGDIKRSCFVQCYLSGSFRALQALVRPGDRLVFQASENGNNYLRAAEIRADRMDEPQYHAGGYDRLFADELHVTIQRPTKDGREKTVIRDLLLQYSITPANTARAIR